MLKSIMPNDGFVLYLQVELAHKQYIQLKTRTSWEQLKVGVAHLLYHHREVYI